MVTEPTGDTYNDEYVPTEQAALPSWLVDALASTAHDEDITVTLTRGKWGGVIGAIDEVICRLEEREAGLEVSGLRKSLEASYIIIHDALVGPLEAAHSRDGDVL